MQAKIKIKSLAKGLALLDELTATTLTTDGMSLSKLAQSLSAPPNTTHSLLQTLVACGYARQGENARYHLGAKCRQMGILQHAISGDLAIQIMPTLKGFVHEYREVIVFAVLIGGHRAVLAKVDAEQAVQVDSTLVEQDGIFAMPTGRVLFAQADEVTRSQIVSREGWPGSRWNGISSLSQLNIACEAISASGYCRKTSMSSGFVSMAIPVTDASGGPVGSVGCYAPVFRCDKKKGKTMLNGLRKVAEHIAATGAPSTHH